MELLYNYVLHYNPYQELWFAIPREKYLEYWSEQNVPGVLSAKDVNVLVEVISKRIIND
jgi:hypothetical protein